MTADSDTDLACAQSIERRRRYAAGGAPTKQPKMTGSPTSLESESLGNLPAITPAPATLAEVAKRLPTDTGET